MVFVQCLFLKLRQFLDVSVQIANLLLLVALKFHVMEFPLLDLFLYLKHIIFEIVYLTLHLVHECIIVIFIKNELSLVFLKAFEYLLLLFLQLNYLLILVIRVYVQKIDLGDRVVVAAVLLELKALADALSMELFELHVTIRDAHCAATVSLVYLFLQAQWRLHFFNILFWFIVQILRLVE